MVTVSESLYLHILFQHESLAKPRGRRKKKHQITHAKACETLLCRSRLVAVLRWADENRDEPNSKHSSDLCDLTAWMIQFVVVRTEVTKEIKRGNDEKERNKERTRERAKEADGWTASTMVSRGLASPPYAHNWAPPSPSTHAFILLFSAFLEDCCHSWDLSIPLLLVGVSTLLHKRCLFSSNQLLVCFNG